MVRRRRTPQTQRWIRWGAAAVLTFLLVWVAMTWGDREEPPHGSGPQAMPGEEDAPGAEVPPAATDPESARDSPRERGEPTMEPARGDDGASDGAPESSVLSTEPDPERIAELTRAVERSQIDDQVEPETRARLNETDPEEDDEGDAPDATGPSDDSDSGALTQDEEARREALQALIEEEEVDDLETLEALASERGIALTEEEALSEEEALAEEEAMLEEEALAAELEDELEAEVDALLYGDEAAVEPIAGEEVAATGSEATLGAEAAAGGEEAMGADTTGDWEGAVAGMTPAGALAQLGGATPEQVAANAAGYAWASTSALVLALEALRLALADQGTPARVVTRSEAEDGDEEDEPPDVDDADSDDQDDDDREDDEGDERDDEDDTDAVADDDRRPDEILPVEEATLIWAAWSRGVTELRRTQERFYPGLSWMRVEVEEAFEALSPGLPLSEQSEALVELVERAGALLQAMEDAEVPGGAPSPI
ncbi:hypothetical protein FRC96_14670 [Lujinxingia vulgaris]|uniref:Uncharacterized protein n=1 Tax=Lujinxingia vulgaris TaxID=2600176 RepID=A0A5C6WZ08_9DELT|nr:hypothetical protein [Lujinxingia vulgaris]TXD33991.1 hypothetical protein FRC96_14670 [Lujinxingia vulgaris]